MHRVFPGKSGVFRGSRPHECGHYELLGRPLSRVTCGRGRERGSKSEPAQGNAALRSAEGAGRRRAPTNLDTPGPNAAQSVQRANLDRHLGRTAAVFGRGEGRKRAVLALAAPRRTFGAGGALAVMPAPAAGARRGFLSRATRRRVARAAARRAGPSRVRAGCPAQRAGVATTAGSRKHRMQRDQRGREADQGFPGERFRVIHGQAVPRWEARPSRVGYWRLSAAGRRSLNESRGRRFRRHSAVDFLPVNGHVLGPLEPQLHAISADLEDHHLNIAGNDCPLALPSAQN